MSHIFTTGKELVVLTKGPGTLYLLSWASNANSPSTIGGIPTTRSGITPYIISFSHNYTRFAFIWQGEGEAVYQIGDGLERKPLGRAWESASTIHWGATAIVTENVTAHASSALNRDKETTAFIIPTGIV